MGDGRYYTNYQFLSIVMLMLITIVSVIGAIASYYRNKGRMGSMFIFVSFALMSVISILRFIENVIPSMELASSLRVVSCFIFIMCILTMLYYFCIKTFNYLGKNLKTVWIVYLVSFIVLSSTFFIIHKMDAKFFVSNYRFVNIEYTEFYSAIILTVLILILLVSLRYGFAKTRIQKGYSNKTVAAAIVLLFSLPMLFYYLAVKKASYYTNFAELFIFIAICISIGAVNYFDTPLGLSGSVFDRIADSIQNYIIITDAKKSIVYKNEGVKESGLFKETDYFNAFEDMFNESIATSVVKYDRECIKIDTDKNTLYFTYKQSALKNGEKIMGYIISITDITEIMDLIQSIEERAKQTQENNLKLKDYTKIVYELEKEKKINTLLDEVIKNIDSELKRLAEQITKLQTCLDDREFETLVDGVINTNKDILYDVKKAVAAYKQHYS